jgi:hypothetical protein
MSKVAGGSSSLAVAEDSVWITMDQMSSAGKRLSASKDMATEAEESPLSQDVTEQ